MERWGLKFGKYVPKVKSKDLLKTWRIVKGDTVQVISGSERGRQGTVIEVRRNENKVYIEGLNLARKHIRDDGSGKGRIVDIEQGIHVSRVSLVDSTTQKPVKVLEGYVLDPDTGEYRKVRVSKKTLTEIPKPIPEPRERLDKPELVGKFDTCPETASRISFKADLSLAPIPSDCLL